MLCMFPHWVGVFPCHRATASTVNKILLGKLSTWGIPSELHRERGTHTGHIIQSLCKNRLSLQHFHCAYHPQSSGLREWTNEVIKTQLAKLVESFHLRWLKAFPSVLINLRCTLFSKHRLSLFEIIIPVDL